MSTELKDHMKQREGEFCHGRRGEEGCLPGDSARVERAAQTFQSRWEIQGEPSRAAFWYAAGRRPLIYLKAYGESIVCLRYTTGFRYTK